MSPRQILRDQLARAEALGYSVKCGSELEFFLFRDSYEEAQAKGYTDLTYHGSFIEDYHILQTTRDEYVVGAIRRGIDNAGIPVVFSKGEASRGQHEINLEYADALEMVLGVKAGGMRPLEITEETLLVSPFANVLAHKVRLREIENHQIVAFAVTTECAGSRGHGFLMSRLPMDDAGNLLGSVLAHPLPNTHDISTRGVDNLTSSRFDCLHRGNLRTEGGHDDHVLHHELRDLCVVRVSGKIANAHGGELGIYLWVVNDLAQQRNATIRKHLSRRVGEVDRTFDSVAKTKLLG